MKEAGENVELEIPRMWECSICALFMCPSRIKRLIVWQSLNINQVCSRFDSPLPRAGFAQRPSQFRESIALFGSCSGVGVLPSLTA